MNLRISNQDKMIHERGIHNAKKYLETEADLIKDLQDIGSSKLFKKYGESSLVGYAVKFWRLTEPVALGFIAVARKSITVPELQNAIRENKLTVAAANRLVSQITSENADQLITFSQTHTYRETEMELARRNPQRMPDEKEKWISEDCVQLTINISKKSHEKLLRTQSLEAKQGKNLTKGQAVEACIDLYVDRKDPVIKAERVSKRQKAPRVEVTYGRKNYNAAQKNAVLLKTQGKCTHVDQDGKRCNHDRWVQDHHIISVSEGGSNHPDNLTTYCWYHHDMVHQLSLAIDGQVNWLRSPAIPYGTLDFRSNRPAQFWQQNFREGLCAQNEMEYSRLPNIKTPNQTFVT